MSSKKHKHNAPNKGNTQAAAEAQAQPTIQPTTQAETRPKKQTKKSAKKPKQPKQALEKENRSVPMSFRTTPSNADKINKKVEQSGITRSAYLEQCAVGKVIRHHLTEKECEALISLGDARGDLINIRNALNGKSYEQKMHYFRNEQFMKQWISATQKLIDRWGEIMENLTN